MVIFTRDGIMLFLYVSPRFDGSEGKEISVIKTEVRNGEGGTGTMG